MAREFAPLQDLRSVCSLTNCFRKHKFDVVHTHTPKAGLLGPIAAKLAGTPVVVHTIHGLLFHDRMPLSRRAAFWAVEKTTATFSDHLLSQSREDIDVAIRTKLCAASKIRYLGNGIDLCRFTPSTGSQREAMLSSIGLPSQTFVVGTVARLVRDKGLLELFRGCGKSCSSLSRSKSFGHRSARNRTHEGDRPHVHSRIAVPRHCCVCRLAGGDAAVV